MTYTTNMGLHQNSINAADTSFLKNDGVKNRFMLFYLQQFSEADLGKIIEKPRVKDSHAYP
jgi:hypothetical protein